jgi:hypothetical protein
MRAWIAAVLACGLLGLAGCGGGGPIVSTVTQPTAPLPGAALTGIVSSGSQPVVGAHVYLLAANATGYGGVGIAASNSNASVSVVAEDETGDSDAVGAYVVTGANGQFSLTGDYACSSGQQLYLYALGGNTGSGVNSAAGLMAVVGSCPSSSSPAVFATVNEVSTVAAAYAMAGFATDAAHVSSSGTALAKVGIANAFANATNLASLSTGTALTTTPAGNGTVPQAEINTLADVLASCVSTASSCSTLLGTATADGTATGTRPTDTATAAINIAHHPAANIAALYGMAAANPSFAPVLGALPNDLGVVLLFAGGGLGQAAILGGLAVDGPGNVWVTNYSYSNVVELASSGAVLSGANGYTGGGLNVPAGIAIDGSGNAWIANSGGNSGGNSVTELSKLGSPVAGSPYVGGGLDAPQGVAIDGSGNVWIANYSGNSVTKLSSSGSFLSGTNGYTGIVLGGPWGPWDIAIDGSGNAWIGSETVTANAIAELSSSGNPLSGASGYTSGGSDSTAFVAIDSLGDAWVTGDQGDIAKLSNTGSVLSGPNGYAIGLIGGTGAIAIDGSGNAWTTNGHSVLELSSSGAVLSGNNGYVDIGAAYPSGVAIDGSGNIWAIWCRSDCGAVEYVGMATPVITPIVAGLPATPTADGSSKLGTRP